LGADKPWDVPTSGWHWDGQHFRHFVDSPEQGLLVLCIFSEVGPQGGGTVVAEGSHTVVARYLAEHPEGVELSEGIAAVNARHPWFRKLTGADPIQGRSRIAEFMETAYVDEDGVTLRVTEVTASPGDVVLCHPFIYHASAQNLSGVPRFMCNRTAALKSRMQIGEERPQEPLSVVERTIREAVGTKA
jgi:ectoine hydroxylase-related dioxygenase (phytanoyl-CoA dioxygenase family)